MDYLTLAKHAVRPVSPDKIFAASQKAKQAIRELGEDAVINSTLGECLDDAGKLMVLPTVERMLHEMPVTDICSYAPIAGIPGFNEAVQISLFGAVREDCFVETVATPGGCGALRHAIWNFLDDTDAVITTNYHWGPYRGICEEHNRRLETFEMFNEQDRFHLSALEEKMTEVMEIQDQILLILNTPANNPTGYSMTVDEMKQVVEIIRRLAADKTKKITLCLDVSYLDFDAGMEESRAIFQCMKDMPENTMTTLIFSMSKSYTMCGMRCGALVCMAQTAESAAAFKQAMSFSSRSTWSNVVRSAQKVLTDICLNPAMKVQVEKEREVFRAIISERGALFSSEANKAGLKCCPYQHGYFITIPCANADAVAARLQEEQVYVVPMPQGLRFSPCAVTKDKCRRAVWIIKDILDENVIE